MDEDIQSHHYHMIIASLIYILMMQTDTGLSYSDLGCREQPLDSALVMEQSAGCGPDGVGQLNDDLVIFGYLNDGDICDDDDGARMIMVKCSFWITALAASGFKDM